MNESSSPCDQRRITFNDHGQRVQLARPELPGPHYMCMYRLLPTTPPSPSRHYYPRLIAGTNLPTTKGWIAWLATTGCTHITFAQGYYTIESKGTWRKWTQVVGPKTNSIPVNQRAVHYKPRIKAQKTARSAVGFEPTTFWTAATDDDKD